MVREVRQMSAIGTEEMNSLMVGSLGNADAPERVKDHGVDPKQSSAHRDLNGSDNRVEQ